jgi:hypothetical protein
VGPDWQWGVSKCWREMSPSITDWRSGLASLLGAPLQQGSTWPSTVQGLPPFGTTSCFICLAPIQENGSDRPFPPIAADVLPILSIPTKRPTHLATSHLWRLTTHQQTSGRPTLLCTYRRKYGNGMARGARSQSNPSHPAQWPYDKQAWRLSPLARLVTGWQLTLNCSR